jgi:uncharacterized cupin superfamily protein
MTEKPTSMGADGIFEPFHIDRVPAEEFSKGERFASRFQQLGEFGGAAQVGVCMESHEPGTQACPAHYHLLEEEHLMILEGELTVRLGARTDEMSAGHYVCFPAGQKAAHALINNGKAPCRYLLIGERLTGEGYRQSGTMEYRDEQPT